MSNHSDNGRSGSYASPPCYMHELDPAYGGLAEDGDPTQFKDVARWRKVERVRLIESRQAISSQDRRGFDNSISTHLRTAIGPVEGKVVSAYWPFRGEPNLHPFMKEVNARGGCCALPVVVRRGEPLIFRAWSPGDPLERGVWNIPIPKDGTPILVPDILIAPIVGFDRACFRLGYGGGFFDRTLASMPKRPNIFGVGYSIAEIRTIYPQWHDIPMDLVITEAGPITPVPDESAG